MGDIPHMQDDIGGLHFFQGRAERGHQMGRQVGDEAHRVGQDHLAAGRQFDRPHGRVERREQQVLGEDIGPRHPVEQRRLAGVGIADQGPPPGMAPCSAPCGADRGSGEPLPTPASA